MTPLKYVLCIGDSLTGGARDEYQRGYPVELARLYHEKKGQDVFAVNHAVNGDTTGHVLRRVYFNSRSVSEAKVALLLVGTNDSVAPNPVDIYADNLRQICTLLKHNHETLGLGLLPPLIGPGLANYPQNGQEFIDQYNRVIERTARTFEALLCDFRDMHSLIIDTVHFGNEGYREMAHRWFDVLEKNHIEL
jgi:lysophospholipase L1-like esterase